MSSEIKNMAKNLKTKPARVPPRKLIASAKGLALKLVKRDKPKKKKPSIYGTAGVYFLLK